MTENYFKKTEEIDKKKLKLFKEKDISKWNISKEVMKKFDMNKIFDDFDKVKGFMLPEESAPFKEDEKLNRFLDKHVLFEYFNFYNVS